LSNYFDLLFRLPYYCCKHTSSTMQTYVGCRCLSDTVWNSSWPEVRSSYDVTARPGLCVSPCSLVIVFGVVVSLASLIRSIGHVPNVVIGFRYAPFCLIISFFCRAILCLCICRHAVSVRPSVCLSRSYILSNEQTLSSIFLPSHHCSISIYQTSW